MQSVLKSAVIAGLLALGTPAIRAAEPEEPVAILTVTRMCCAKESVPAIKELNKIPGVSRVVADHKARTLTIMGTDDWSPSPRAIWEVAEKLNINPVRLATTECVYQKKPAQ